MNILHIVGARPNFMKVAPVMRALNSYKAVKQCLIHTGQHYDDNMSKVFFEELELPRPDINLEVGSDSHARQTAEVMIRLEPEILERKPELVLVYGDINSTIAAALVCAKLGVPLGHVEAGLRSFDRSMPEEINRLLTDQVADFLFTPSLDGNKNLLREGISKNKIHFVGNVMIDTLVNLLPKAKKKWEDSNFLSKILRLDSDIIRNQYGLVTLHRPSNVDETNVLISIVNTLDDISSSLPLIFPIHPRTCKQLESQGFKKKNQQLYLVDPLSYLDFLALQCHAKVVITDSGGIQEETTYLGIPCLTLRKNTERPITVTKGTNVVIGQDMDRLKREIKKVLNGRIKKGKVPPLWDGRASERIAQIVFPLNKKF